MSIQNIVTLLEFCLKNTCFLFQGKYYEQVQGTAMGSPISPLIADLFMEEFEVKALSSFPHPPSLWLRFVDDIFLITKTEHSQLLLQHINSQDPYIQFAVEEPSQQGTLPFLNTLVTVESNNTFSTTFYRKPTHTDQYLHWDSNHFTTAKVSKHIGTQCQNCLIRPRSFKPRITTHQEGPTGLPISSFGTKPTPA